MNILEGKILGGPWPPCPPCSYAYVIYSLLCAYALMCTTIYLLLAKPGKRLTEDHYFMRSKTLHRDEDMLQDALRAKVATFFLAIGCIWGGAWEQG